jgi:hypothetical protein
VRRCWLLIITKRLQVWMPPELYLDRGVGAREAGRWVETLSRRRPPDDLLAASPFALRDEVLLHFLECEVMEPWRACPLWVFVRWSETSYPRIAAELFAADPEEAAVRVRNRAKTASVVQVESGRIVACTLRRRGVTSHVAAHRVKRVNGF